MLCVRNDRNDWSSGRNNDRDRDRNNDLQPRNDRWQEPERSSRGSDGGGGGGGGSRWNDNAGKGSNHYNSSTFVNRQRIKKPMVLNLMLLKKFFL